MSRQIFSESEKVCLQELIIKYKLHSTATINAGNPAVKRTAWMQLTKEYNSVETNSKRTEAQLKKCWDNLKTPKKALLAYEKKERMRTGGGPFYPKPGPAKDDPILLDEALIEQTDEELLYVVDSDNLPVDTSQDILHFETVSYPESEPGPQSQVSMVDTDPETERGTRNIRAHVIQHEFSLRQENYKRAQAREDELHKLNVEEKKLLIKAAEEMYKKACLEREAAELKLKILAKDASKHQ